MLIHGTGSSRAVWGPVTGLLSDCHELILLDLQGHGRSELPPLSVTPSPIGYAPLLADLLDELGLQGVHAAGNSSGAWTSLEPAKLGRTRSVTGLGPAGLWRPRSPRSTEASLWLTNGNARRLARVLPYAFSHLLGADAAPQPDVRATVAADRR
jgi:pimeloyl-ACP methyl ester carboxylesterase